MSSQSAGNQPPAIPGSSTHNPAQSTQVATLIDVQSLTNAVLSILKDTVWPRRSTSTARELIAILENASSLKNIPKNNPHIEAEQLLLLEQFVAVMVSVRPKLQKASDTYGAKERTFRSKAKYLFTYLDRNKCTEVLESCRNEVNDALAALPDHWILENITGEMFGSYYIDDDPTDTFTRLSFDVVYAEDQPEKSNDSQPQEDTPLTGNDLPATTVEEQIDHETDPIPQIVTSESTVATPNPSQDEGSAVPVDQVDDPPKRREWLGGMKTMFNAVEGISGMIPVIGTYVGAAAKVGGTVVDIIQQMGDNEEAAKGLTSHTRQLSNMLQRFENGSVDGNRGELTALIGNLQRELQDIQQRVTDLNSSSALKKAFSSADRSETLKGYQDTIRTALEQIQVRNPSSIVTALAHLFAAQLLATLNTTTLITELYDEGMREQHQRLLDRLGDASYGARGDSIEDVICLKGTRVEILERINAWIKSTSSSEKVLWIRGMAGRGKSTIASTVAHHWKYQAATAIFHFRRGQNETDKRLVCALARQLGCSTLVPEVKEAILNSIREKPDIGQGRLRDQFLALFRRSLSRIQNTSVPILLVVDALDECEDVDYAVNFVKLLDEISSSLPANVKFLLTTRPETPLIRALEPRPWHALDLDQATSVDDDIAAFLEHGFSKIRRDREEYELEVDWPGPDNMGAILQMSQGLFQWARTAIEYMMEGSPQDRLQEILNLPGICDGMDNLYLTILSKAFEKAKKNPLRGEIFVHLLGTLVAAPSPISLEIFTYLVADHPAIQNKSPTDAVRYLRLEVLRDVRSLIHIPDSSTGPIRLMHTSIRDLLVDIERCRREPYSVDLDSRHGYLASKCLEQMERDLKTNICNLSDLSKANSDSEIQDLVRVSVPQGLQYCCCNWSTHLTQGMPGLAADAVAIILPKFKRLCEEKLLGWLEVISLIGETQASITVAKQMHLWSKVCYQKTLPA
ncbi:hypothetical protein FS837_005444 [Tulasnella sp. UAMH 9824]|nr:hypothetical protein FS837_005444 [Tulasnella sp. UAMH 9824]